MESHALKYSKGYTAKKGYIPGKKTLTRWATKQCYVKSSPSGACPSKCNRLLNLTSRRSTANMLPPIPWKLWKPWRRATQIQSLRRWKNDPTSSAPGAKGTPSTWAPLLIDCGVPFKALAECYKIKAFEPSTDHQQKQRSSGPLSAQHFAGGAAMVPHLIGIVEAKRLTCFP